MYEESIILSIITTLCYIVVVAGLYFNNSFKKEGLFCCFGRLNRLAYFTRLVYIAIAYYLFQLIFKLFIFIFSFVYFCYIIGTTALIIVQIIFKIMLYTATLRRFHDLNLSGKYLIYYLISSTVLSYLLLSFFPQKLIYNDFAIATIVLLFLINLILTIYLLFIKGSNGTNKYGSDPLAAKIMLNAKQ